MGITPFVRKLLFRLTFHAPIIPRPEPDLADSPTTEAYQRQDSGSEDLAESPATEAKRRTGSGSEDLADSPTTDALNRASPISQEIWDSPSVVKKQRQPPIITSEDLADSAEKEPYDFTAKEIALYSKYLLDEVSEAEIIEALGQDRFDWLEQKGTHLNS